MPSQVNTSWRLIDSQPTPTALRPTYVGARYQVLIQVVLMSAIKRKIIYCEYAPTFLGMNYLELVGYLLRW